MNVSKSGTTTDDGISMYLSFESTSVCTSEESAYKTLAEDASTTEENDLNENEGNTTLEPIKDSDLNDLLKDVDTTTLHEIAPLRINTMNIMQEFKALSSTPSKLASPFNPANFKKQVNENEIRNVDSYVERSNAHLSAVFSNLVTEFEEEENKENEQPNSSENSLPSFSKASLMELQKKKDELSMTKPEKAQTTTGIVKSFKSKSLEVNAEEALIGNKQKKEVEMKTALRKSICEPNLKTNRPSRIVSNKNKRFSLMTTQNKRQSIITDRYKTMQQFSTINETVATSNLPTTTSTTTAPTTTTATTTVNTKKSTVPVRRSMNVKTIGANRKSMIPNNMQTEKRPTPKRMPAIVKTTLNSATRRSTRSSSTSSTASVSKRRSILLLQSKLTTPLNKRKKRLSTDTNSTDDRMAIKRGVGGAEKIQNSPRKRMSTAPPRKTIYIEKPNDVKVKFACTECGASYNVKSLLDAHKKTSHRSSSPDKKSPRFQSSSAACTSANNAIVLTNACHQCKYCDKGFALERALHIHLMQHCMKIPAADRRKLDFTEMDHVKKEQTPHFRGGPTRPFKKPISFPTLTQQRDPLTHLLVKPTTTLAEDEKTLNELKIRHGMELFEKQHHQKKADMTTKIVRNYSPTRQVGGKSLMAPPTSNKFKKSAHTGVYRTPNKDIPCIPCKRSFKNVLDFTNHMATHAGLDASINSIGGHAK